jgi:hypothetical protein
VRCKRLAWSRHNAKHGDQAGSRSVGVLRALVECSSQTRKPTSKRYDGVTCLRRVLKTASNSNAKHCVHIVDIFFFLRTGQLGRTQLYNFGEHTQTSRKSFEDVSMYEARGVMEPEDRRRSFVQNEKVTELMTM